MTIALLVLRLVVGLLFMGHGSQKLFGLFGGGGVEGTTAFFGSIGLGRDRRLAVLAGLGEFLGGLLLVLGFLTPLATALLAGVMFTAIFVVHWPRVWVSEGGLEYPLVNLAAAFAVTAGGSGSWSIDSALGLDWNTWWALGAVALGLVGALVAIWFGRHRLAATGVDETRGAVGEPPARAA